MTQWGLDNLFNPGKRHMDDEKRRLQSTREEVGDNSGGRRIDLEGGKVAISVPRRAEQPAELDPALDADDVPAVALASDETEIEPTVVDDATDATAEPEPEPAVAPAEPEPTQRPSAAAPPPAPPAAEAEQAAAPPRRKLSANAWSRRG